MRLEGPAPTKTWRIQLLRAQVGIILTKKWKALPAPTPLTGRLMVGVRLNAISSNRKAPEEKCITIAQDQGTRGSRLGRCESKIALQNCKADHESKLKTQSTSHRHVRCTNKQNRTSPCIHLSNCSKQYWSSSTSMMYRIKCRKV